MGAYQRKLKDGIKWRYKGYLKGTYYSSPAIYETKEEALIAERVFLAGNKDDTLEHLMNERIKHLRVNATSKKHLRQNELDFDIAKGAWGHDMKVDKVTKSMAQNLINDEAERRFKENKSMHSVNKTLRSLNAFFNYCIDDKEIPMLNPFKAVKLMPVSDKKKYIPSDMEVYLLRQNLNSKQTSLFDFVAETGCRIAEALRLKGEDIMQNTITLYTRKAKNSNLTPRVIPRPECLIDRIIPADPDQRIFHQWVVGEPKFLERNVKSLINEQKEGKTPFESSPFKKWNWHNLRHRAASLWAKANIPIFEISQRLGHANVKTTQIYLQTLGFSPVPFTQYGRGAKPHYDIDYFPEEFAEEC